MRVKNTYKVFFLLILLITGAGYVIAGNAVGGNVKKALTDSVQTTKKSSGGSVLTDKVHYSAKDSMRFDVKQQKVYLFGDAQVIYKDVKLKAAYISFDMKDNIVSATGAKDSLGKPYGEPVFTQGDQTFNAEKIRYDFKTKKGKIDQVLTKEGEGYIHGKVVKKDTNKVYYVKDGEYTTCDLPHPHFYIAATKLKVIPNDKIITGPAWLVVEGVPTPLAIPFGFFPNHKGRASGILMPMYGESTTLGFFLQNGGYYWGINDHIDLALRGDIYSRGSWGLKAQSDYKLRYHYSGSFSFSYSDIILGDPELPTSSKKKDFFIRWTHNQDPKARPNSRFSADVNAGSSSYNTYNSYDAGNYLSNTFQSNISYSKSWPGTPFNLAVSARHNQNTITKAVDIELPQLTFSVNRQYPADWFKKPGVVANKWYDKIGFSWLTNASNKISTIDTMLFKPQTLNKMQNGVQNSIPITASFPIAKYFNFTSGLNASSTWYFKTISKRLNVANDSIITDTITGFKMANQYSLSEALNTRIYGNYFFKGKRIKQIRHVMIPSVGFSYRPDFSESQYGYYKNITDTLGNTQEYSIFQNGIYGSPPSGQSGLLTLSLDNNLGMKVQKRDSSGNVTNKKLTIFQTLAFSTNYNLALKKFNWAPVSISGRIPLIKNIDITFGGVMDLYQLDTSGARINSLAIEHNNGLGRLTSATASINATLKSKTTKDGKPTQQAKINDQEVAYLYAHPNAYVDFNIPWSLNAYYTMRYSKPQFKEEYTQSLTFGGNFSVTKYWQLGFTSGYDFQQKQFTYTSISAYRDLHCWQMSFTWIPFGMHQSYSVDIHVKASVLQDLKITRHKDWYDNLQQ